MNLGGAYTPNDLTNRAIIREIFRLERVQVLEDSDEIGYCLVEPERQWRPVQGEVRRGQKLGDDHTPGYIKFDTGASSWR